MGDDEVEKPWPDVVDIAVELGLRRGQGKVAGPINWARFPESQQQSGARMRHHFPSHGDFNVEYYATLPDRRSLCRAPSDQEWVILTEKMHAMSLRRYTTWSEGSSSPHSGRKEHVYSHCKQAGHNKSEGCRAY